MSDIIADSVAFPLECQKQLSISLGKASDSYIATLNNFTSDFVGGINHLFVNRLNNLAFATKAENDYPSDDERRKARVNAQIQAFNPKILADEIKSAIDQLIAIEKYNFNLTVFLGDPFTSDLIKRYQLSEDIYLQLMNGAVRSLNLLFSEMNGLVAANQNLVKSAEQLNKSNGLRKGVAFVAGIAGAIFGAGTGISHGAGMGSRLAGGLVRGLFGGNKTIDAALNRYSESFNRTHQVWLEVQGILSDELMGVVYSIYGGALLRLVGDLHAVGLTVSKLHFDSNRLGAEGKIRISLHGDAKAKFHVWAKDSHAKINQLINQGDFSAAYSAASHALQFCLSNKARLQEVDEGLHSYVLSFQRQFVWAVVKMADKLGSKDAKRKLILWLQACKHISFLPDEESTSTLIPAIVAASQSLRSKEKKIEILAVELIDAIQKIYIGRAQNLFFVRSSYQVYESVPNEFICDKSVFILAIATAFVNQRKTESLRKQLESIEAVKAVVNKRGLNWYISCLFSTRGAGASWGNVLVLNLAKRIASRFLMLAGIAALVFVVGFLAFYDPLGMFKSENDVIPNSQMKSVVMPHGNLQQMGETSSSVLPIQNVQQPQSMLNTEQQVPKQENLEQGESCYMDGSKLVCRALLQDKQQEHDQIVSINGVRLD